MGRVSVTNGSARNKWTQEMLYKFECECLQRDFAHILTAWHLSEGKNRTYHQNKAWFGPAAFTCLPTFDGTFSLWRQHRRTLTRKTRLGHLKRGLARKTCPNKRVNEEADSRRVEEKENNLRRRIKGGESRKSRRGMKEEEEERR